MTEFLTLIWEILVGVSDPNLHLAMVWQAAAISAGASLIGGKRQQKAASRQAALARKDQQEQRAILEKQKQEYRDIKFTNPYAGMENPYAENVYEDLTVNQQQAQFQAQQGAQQRANVMESMRGAAGASGIAGLAQTLVNQGALQTQQISASIGQQEAMNQRLAAQGAQQVQAGRGAVDLQIRQGEAMVQEAESGRQATLLGMQYGSTAGSQSAYQQSLLNQQQANASANQMFTQGISGLAGADWSGFGGGYGAAPAGTTVSGGQSHAPDTWKSFY
jgi:hypothetical protein